jgi:acyl-CoA thioester hydrolase
VSSGKLGSQTRTRPGTREGLIIPPASPATPMHEKRIEIRWRDQDAYGHVNNAVYLTFLEEVRDAWLARTLGEEGDLWGYVVARVAIDFRRELKQDDGYVIARCELQSIGTSSVRTREGLVAGDGTLAAEAEAVLVARDPDSGASRPLTAVERAAFVREAGTAP